MIIEEFDVFVIGTGIAGQTVAEACVKQKLKVAMTDKRAYGGTCANRGCDPKKIILGITEILESAQKLEGKGIKKVPKASWQQVIAFKKEFTTPIPVSTEKKLNDLGITLYHQAPTFVDNNTLLVEGKKIKATTIVIASGLIPRPLDISGASLTLTSDEFLTLETLPDSMIFIGAGYIGMEFAHMAARFGVEVTVIDSGERPLSVFDEDLVNHLVEASKNLGIKFIGNAQILSIEALRINKRVHYMVNGEKKSTKAALIFNTTGRIPSIHNLDLEIGGVSYSERGVEVNEYLQNPKNTSVFACGDVSDHSVPLTPLSTREAKVVAHNILNNSKKKIEVPVIPSVAFTLPNIAAVGLSEKEAKQEFGDITVNTSLASEFFNAKRINQKIYGYKTIINAKNNQILGAHLIGPEAGEIINLFAMAMYKNMTTNEIKDMIFTYPSWSGDIQYMI